MINGTNVATVFSYHAPTPAQVEQMKAIRDAAKELATTILLNTPQSADQQAALRKLRECVMTANASIVLDGTGA